MAIVESLDDVGMALTAIDPAHTDRREVGMLLTVDKTWSQTELVLQVFKAAQSFVVFDVEPGDIRVEGVKL